MTSISIELYRWLKLPYSQYCFTAIQLPSGKNQVREHETNIYSECVSTNSSDEVYSPMSRRHNTILYVRNTKPKLIKWVNSTQPKHIRPPPISIEHSQTPTFCSTTQQWIRISIRSPLDLLVERSNAVACSSERALGGGEVKPLPGCWLYLARIDHWLASR